MTQEHSEILQKLYGLQNIGIKLGLDRVFELFERTGNPQKNLRFIHVAGTNGKGSVCSIVAKALQSAGYKVGFFSSPHLVSLRERFRINGNGISWEELSLLFNQIWPLIQEMKKKGKHITFFEATVAIAAKYFAKNDCDFVLWETGLGGRLDGTNIVDPLVTAITGIGLDHEEILGETEEKIAKEKAGIIKRNIPVFVGEMSYDAYRAVKNDAIEKNAPLYSVKNVELQVQRAWKKNNILPGWFFGEDLSSEKYFFPFVANVQYKNLKLAYAILKYMSKEHDFSLENALRGIENLKWPGRIQILSDGKILDGAHNPQGIKVFVDTMQSCFPEKQFKVIFGCMAERNPKESIILLKQIASEFIFTPIESSRESLSPERIFDIVKNDIDQIPVRITENSDEALVCAGKSETVIAGSLYLAGEILKKYYSTEDIIAI